MKAEELWLSRRARAVFALLFVCVAGANGALRASDTKPAESVLTVTEAENGKDVDLAPGQILQVKLKSSAAPATPGR